MFLLFKSTLRVLFPYLGLIYYKVTVVLLPASKKIKWVQICGVFISKRSGAFIKLVLTCEFHIISVLE